MPTPGSTEARFPEVYNQTDIDRRGRKRTVDMKVIVIGMMRTGTMSQRTALQQLGYNNVYHMVEVIKNPRDADLWTEAYNAKFKGIGKKWDKADWDALLGDYEACLDVPTAAFMPELIAAYPDAKVIVCMRDPDAWYKSVQGSIGKGINNPVMDILAYLDTVFLNRFLPMANASISGLFGPSGVQDEDHTKKVYVSLHEEVRRIVPKERLLEFQLKQGWGPLCRFLGKDIPDTPYPRVNESAEFAERMGVIMKLAMIRVAKRYLPIVGAVAVMGGAWCMM